MARRCARPDCSLPADTTLIFDYGDATGWLEQLTEERDPMNHDLCDRHADSLSVPRGWQLRDRRAVPPVPLFGSAIAS